MKAIVFKQPGVKDQLIVSKQTKPKPMDHEVLIQVQAAAINRMDLITRKNKTRHTDFPILGIEVAGIVEEAGEKTNIKPGMRVMGLVNGGGYAEYAVMPADRVIEIPKHLTFKQAAAIPEVFLTAYQTLYWKAKLSKGETVLIHAGGSGVGTAAIQLTKQLSEAHVITTAGTQEKITFTETLGADYGINYKEDNFAEAVLNITNNQGVDVILDFIGASYWDKNIQSIAIDGRIVLIGLLGGAKVDQMNLWDLMQKRIQLTGTLLTPRSNVYKAALTKKFIKRVMPFFETDKIQPVIDSVYSFEEVQQAHKQMENNANIGKIILHPS